MVDDARDDREPTEAAGTSRRRLLRVATGGFVLATSGLFLPEGLEEAEAREGVLGGVKGGRHGTNHRDRNKRRNHRNKRKHDRRSNRAGQWRNVALYIHNLRPTAVAVRQWKTISVDDIIRWGPMTDWLPIDGRTGAEPEHFIDFVSDLKGFVVEINTGHVIEVSNPLLSFLPHLDISEGGWSEHGWDPRGKTLINQGFFEWEIARAPGFGVQRLTDTPTHKRFLVDLA